jgi:hypothetical protein
MVTIERKLGGERTVSGRLWMLWFATLASCGLFAAATPAQEAPKAVEFQEMRFTLPGGRWDRSPGSPPSRQVLFTLNQGAGRVQTLSISRVNYPKSMYGLTPEEHTTNIWNYEQFEKPRPVAWVDFARSKRPIAGKEYPVMTYQWHHPTASSPEVMADGIFLAYFPHDFQERERFYILQWEDIHPPAVKQHGWESLDQVIGSFSVGPIQESVAGSGTTLHKEFTNVWYRPRERGFSFMPASGKLVITESRLVFGEKDDALEIGIPEIKSVGLGKLPGDFINDWVIVRYGEPEKVAGFKDANKLGRVPDPKPIYFALKAAFESSVPPAKVALVNPETKKSVTCPEALFEPRMMSNEQAAQERAWRAEFQRVHKRLPTPMEGCIKAYEILGFVRTTTEQLRGRQ